MNSFSATITAIAAAAIYSAIVYIMARWADLPPGWSARPEHERTGQRIIARAILMTLIIIAAAWIWRT